MTKETEKPKKTVSKYSKSAFLDAEQNSKERLLLNTLLEEDKTYTKAEVEKVVKQWKAKAIKKETKEVKA